MSGIDEQNLDITSCDCEGFQHWTAFMDNIVVAYINPEAWGREHGVVAINRLSATMDWSSDDFINKVTAFRCHVCNRAVERGCPLFEMLCRDVKREWLDYDVRTR